jgi:hypothetical protein
MPKKSLLLILIVAPVFGFSQVSEYETKAEVDNYARMGNISRQRIIDNQIHSVKSYSYEPGNASDKGKLYSELFYDDKGNLIEFKNCKKNGKTKYHSTSRWDQANRNLETCELRSNGSVKNRYTNKYDANGNQTDEQVFGRASVFSHKEVSWWHSVATFDNNQNMQTLKFYLGKNDQKLFDRYEYFYYDDGSKKQTVQYNRKNKVLYTWNYDCDPAGKPEGKNLKDSGQVCIRYETDKAGNKIKVKEQNVKYAKVSRIVTRYDKNENEIESISYRSNGKPVYHFISVYDDKNNRISYTTFIKGSDKVRERSEYQYDTTGNVTERIAYKGATPERIVKFNYSR